MVHVVAAAANAGDAEVVIDGTVRVGVALVDQHGQAVLGGGALGARVLLGVAVDNLVRRRRRWRRRRRRRGRRRRRRRRRRRWRAVGDAALAQLLAAQEAAALLVA